MVACLLPDNGSLRMVRGLRVRGWSCEPNNQLNVCTTSVTEGEVAGVKIV